MHSIKSFSKVFVSTKKFENMYKFFERVSVILICVRPSIIMFYTYTQLSNISGTVSFLKVDTTTSN